MGAGKLAWWAVLSHLPACTAGCTENLSEGDRGGDSAEETGIAKWAGETRKNTFRREPV